MPRPEDTLEQLARLARDDEVLHAASERGQHALSSVEHEPNTGGLPESLTQPLSEAQQSSFVDAIQARLVSHDRVRSSVRPAPRVRRRMGAIAAAVALTAAAAGILLAPRGGSDAGGPLSRYVARLEGAEQSERGNTQAAGPLRLRAGSQLRFELRPQRDERGSVRARAFMLGLVAAGSREKRELEITQEQSPVGALRVAAQLPTALSERGELLLYVGRPAALERALPNDEPGRVPAPSQLQEFRFQFERAP